MHKVIFVSIYLGCPKPTCVISCNLDLGLFISKLVVYIVYMLVWPLAGIKVFGAWPCVLL